MDVNFIHQVIYTCICDYGDWNMGRADKVPITDSYIASLKNGTLAMVFTLWQAGPEFLW